MRFLIFILLILGSIKSSGQDVGDQLATNIYESQMKFLSDAKLRSDSGKYLDEIDLITRMLPKFHKQELENESLRNEVIARKISRIPVDSMLYIIEMHNLNYFFAVIYKMNGLILRQSFKVDPASKAIRTLIEKEDFSSEISFSKFQSEIDFSCSALKVSYVSYFTITNMQSDTYESLVIPIACKSDSLSEKIKFLIYGNSWNRKKK